jgi:hypothetical protein
MTTTVKANPTDKPRSVNTATESVPSGAETEREYVPAKSDPPETKEEKEVERFANETARKGVKTEQKFDAANSNLFSK